MHHYLGSPATRHCPRLGLRLQSNSARIAEETPPTCTQTQKLWRSSCDVTTKQSALALPAAVCRAAERYLPCPAALADCTAPSSCLCKPVCHCVEDASLSSAQQTLACWHDVSAGVRKTQQWMRLNSTHKPSRPSLCWPNSVQCADQRC